MPITLLDTCITVQFEVGDLKGGSWDEPYTLDDVVDAIVNVTKQGCQIYIPYFLWIKGSNTYFLAEDMQVCFDDTDVSSGYIFLVDTPNFKSKGVNRGMSWTNSGTGNKMIRINYGGEIDNSMFCKFHKAYWLGAIDNHLIIKNTTFIYMIWNHFPYNEYVEIEDVTFLDGTNRFLAANFYSADGFVLKNISWGIWNNTDTLRIKNAVIKNASMADFYVNNYGTKTVEMVDSLVNLSSYHIRYQDDGNTTIDNISTFKINIENGDGASAKLYDQNDNLIWTEILSGELKKEVVFENLYAVSLGGQVIEDILTIYEPFKLVISKAGYQDLEIPGITITPGDQTNTFGILRPPVYADPIPEVEIDEEPTTIALIEVETE